MSQNHADKKRKNYEKIDKNFKQHTSLWVQRLFCMINGSIKLCNF